MRPVALATLSLILATPASLIAGQAPSPSSAAKPAAVARVPAPTPSGPRASAPKPNRPPVVDVQPRLIAVNVERCFACTTAAKKRLGVMPVRVGALSNDLGAAAPALADKVRDALEASVARSRNVVVVNRSDLGDVLAEQRLAASGVVNKELAPLSHAIVPAQILLYATIDRADVSVKTEKNSNNTAAAFYRQALEKEQEAARYQERARQAAAELQRETTTPSRPGWAQFGEALDAIDNCGSRPTPGLAQACENQKRLNQMNRDREHSNTLRSAQQHLSEAQNDAQTAQADADMLRRRADIESRREVTETKTTALDLTVTWRAIDTSTGAVVGSGYATGARVTKDEGRSSQSAFQGTESTSSTRYDALVNGAISQAITAIGPAVEAKIATVPFRAKIAVVDAEGVIINAGANLGMNVGDTFGVRQTTSALTDPDTGELLTSPGPAVGLIRVVEVFEKTSRAQLMKQAVPVKRGDELEWIGVFQLASDQSSASARER